MTKKTLLSPITDSPATIDDSPVDRIEFSDVVDRISTVTSQVTEIKHAQQEMQKNQAELKISLGVILQKLNTIQTKQTNGGSNNTVRDLSPEFNAHVPFFNLESSSRIDEVERREKLLKHVDFPFFNRANLYGWIARVERYCRIAQLTESQLLDQVSVSLTDDALGWLNWEMNRVGFSTWKEFKSRILMRFGNLRVKGPSQSLCCIKQSGSVPEYVKQFEDLSAQVTGLDDNMLEGIFLNGLQPDIQELVFMMKPTSLPEMIAVALSIEHSQIRQSMNNNAGVKHQERQKAVSVNKGNSVSFTSWTPKAASGEINKASYKNSSVPIQRPQRNHTRAELDEMRKRHICFKCYGPWSKEHDCPSKELRVLTVLDEYMVEVSFMIGEMVYLKLRPYRQTTVAKRFCQKLAAKYYGPFEIIEKIGKVAYRLALPDESKIHNVFHVSQLKLVLGSQQQVNPLPVLDSDADGFVLLPESILDTKYNEKGVLEALVHWKGLPTHENSWESVKGLKHQFPDFKLEDKLSFVGGGGGGY
ncbi:hypothetical protein V5N11_013501 [Cardamine amara subsp. amara]|uniref:Chromo domain-containing protein n=1 Tax=Cardamine amara subsp. amara TaxID=228776 RepID=A0ABD1ALL6_CARAN